MHDKPHMPAVSQFYFTSDASISSLPLAFIKFEERPNLAHSLAHVAELLQSMRQYRWNTCLAPVEHTNFQTWFSILDFS